MNLYTIDNKLKLGFVILVWNSEKVIKNCITSINSMKKIDSQGKEEVLNYLSKRFLKNLYEK